MSEAPAAVVVAGINNKKTKKVLVEQGGKTSSSSIPLLRDSKQGWKHFVALGYAIVADVVALGWMIYIGGAVNATLMATDDRHDAFVDVHHPPLHTTAASSSFGLHLLLLWIVQAMGAIGVGVHGRVVASYLIHEAAHHTIFQPVWANEWFGRLCLIVAACPYADFDQIRKMHLLHHRDRADPVEFDYRDFVRSGGPLVKYVVLGMEYCFIPIVETIMHCRTAFFPIIHGSKCTPSRRMSAYIGTPAMMMFYYSLWTYAPNGAGPWVLAMTVIQGALLVHFLSMSDAFHHTYEAIFMNEPDYKPGPQGRTAQFEEDNTYSNVLSIQYPWLNILVLNFGYHNAHHKKPMIPWYALPEWHKTLYRGKKSGTVTAGSATPDKDGKDDDVDNTIMNEAPNVIPVADILYAWYHHRLTRILEEDYGIVHPPGTPGRANDFVGALGVSFLTV